MARNIATNAGVYAYALFIAELNGFKSGTELAKAQFGIECYQSTVLHDLDPNSEDDRAEFHENFWLQRIYNELDNYFDTAIEPIDSRTANYDQLLSVTTDNSHKWSTPIEEDASASMLQWMGVLLNDERLMSMTNVIGDTLTDPWNFEGIPRKQFKTAATPMLYGSSKPCHELWSDAKIAYTLEQVQLFNTELSSGALGVANAFKDFLINNCKPTETMQPHIIDEVFTIECNRYKHIGEETKSYQLFDTITNSVRQIYHTDTKKVADLEQFRLYMVTLLVHNIDSQAANYVANKCFDKYNWIIDIHDAFIVCPEAADDVRTWYIEFMSMVHSRREEILANFFKSIGIGAESQAEWDRVKSLIQPMQGEFKPNKMALK